MRFLIDMNLSPKWVEVLGQYGRDTIQWSELGNPLSTDRSIVRWAQTKIMAEGAPNWLTIAVQNRSM